MSSHISSTHMPQSVLNFYLSIAFSLFPLILMSSTFFSQVMRSQKRIIQATAEIPDEKNDRNYLLFFIYLIFMYETRRKGLFEINKIYQP
jgi:hypothetical protein